MIKVHADLVFVFSIYWMNDEGNTKVLNATQWRSKKKRDVKLTIYCGRFLQVLFSISLFFFLFSEVLFQFLHATYCYIDFNIYLHRIQIYHSK